MKATFYLFLCILFYSCATNTQRDLKNKGNFESEFCNVELLTIMNKYIENIDKDSNVVYQLYIEKSMDTTTLLITFEPYKSYLDFPPDAFTKVSNRLVLIYSGLSLIMNPDSCFISRVEKEISSIVFYDQLDPPVVGILDYAAWQIKIDRDNKIVGLTKKSRNYPSLRSIPK